MVGQLLQHLVASFLLAALDFAGNVDLFAVLAVVVERPLEGEVDEAGDPVAVTDRDLPGDERRNTDRLERGEEVADPTMSLVDSIDEENVRNALLVERP